MAQEGRELSRWLERLEGSSPNEWKLGLERISEVLDRLELTLPRHRLMVGGTNGKGSTVTCLHAILEAAGLRTGAYFSPHVHRYNERVRLGDVDASDEQLVAAFEAVEAVRGETPLTYFEYGTLAALVCFSEAELDAVVLEVGLGGRLDAVNAVEPSASLVTNVALDHCDWLGDTIPLIAREKAGIFRAGRPAVFASTDVPDVIIDHAARLGTDLRIAGRDYQYRRDNGHWEFHGQRISLENLDPPVLAGAHQLANAAGALALLEVAGIEETLDSAVVSRALGKLRLSGRMQQVSARDAQWLFDVAHNPASAAALSAALTDRPLADIGIIGMLADKDVEGVLTELDGLVKTWLIVTPDNPRAIDAAELAKQISRVTQAEAVVCESPESALTRAAAAANGEPILVTGSFFLVGPVQRALGL